MKSNRAVRVILMLSCLPMELHHLSLSFATLMQQSALHPPLRSTTRCHLRSIAAMSTMSSAWVWLGTAFPNYMPTAPQIAPLPSERPLIKPADTCLE